MKQTVKVIRTVQLKGRKCEILQEYDRTYLARIQGQTSLFGIPRSDIDAPEEQEPKRNIIQHLFNRRNKPE